VAGSTSSDAPGDGARPWDRIRLLGAAVGGLLLVGGLLTFAVLTFTGDSGTEPDVTTGSSTEPSTDPSSDSESSDPDALPTRDQPLALPLEVPDSGLAQNAEEVPDEIGPESAEFCDERPTTDGLVEWEGSTMSAPPLRFPLLFQQLARFETPQQAEAYVNAYVDSASCEEWIIPAENNKPEIVLRPSRPTTTTSYGDQSAEVVIQGSSSFLNLYGRTAIVRRQNDVYILSITALTEGRLDDVTPLVELALERLDF
jgi:hypothetical protein